jgi:ABC-2 type transport system permease protein
MSPTLTQTAPPPSNLPAPHSDAVPAGVSLPKEVARHLMLLGEYFFQYAKVRIGYRGDFFISLIASTAATWFSLGFILLLFQKIPRLAGWSLAEIVFLYGFSQIPYGLFNILSLNLYEFGNTYIMEGKFDRVLLRPVSSLFQVMFEVFRLESVQEIFTGTFLVWWASHHLGIHWSLLRIGALLFWAVCGGTIYVSFFLLLSTVSFWFEDRIGVHPPFWNLIAFGRYPLSIYSSFIQFMLSWIIPFGFASFYPSVRLLGRTKFAHYAPFIPLVAAICLCIAISSWNVGSRHYSSTGS